MDGSGSKEEVLSSLSTFPEEKLPPSGWRKNWHTVAVIFLTGVVSLVLVGYFLFSSISHEQKVSIQAAGLEYKNLMDGNLKALFLSLENLASFLEIHGNETAYDDFLHFVDPFREGFSFFQAIEWIVEVNDADRESLEERGRLVYGSYFITERDADGHLMNASVRATYYPVFYVTPLVGNENAVGFDLGSNPSRLSALMKSKSIRSVVATERVRLVQESASQYGTLLFQPIHRNNTITGFALGVLRIGDFVESALLAFKLDSLDIFMFDVTVEDDLALLYFKCLDEEICFDTVHEEKYQSIIQVADRKWLIVVAPNRNFPDLFQIGVAISVIVFLGFIMITVGGGLVGWSRVLESRRYGTAMYLLAKKYEESRAESEKDKARALAESKVKSDFIANMSHELRTPLTSIIGYADMLMEEDEDGHLVEDLSRILHSAKHLLSLIEGILDFSKASVGEMHVHVAFTSLSNFVADVVDIVKPLALTGFNSFVVDIQCPRLYIKIDVLKLRQILLNLLSNAFKCTSKGTVTLTVKQLDSGIAFYVKDTGIGIAKSNLESIFAPFRQVDESSTRQIGGTGLGLSLCRKFSELLGGVLDVESELGKGSCFILTLAEIMVEERGGEPKAEAETDMPKAEDGYVLVIDDDNDIRNILVRFIKNFGISAIPAASGAEGIRLAKAKKPVLVTLDIHMPEMSGWQVLQIFRTHDMLQDVPVIMISALDEHELAVQLKASETLMKPVDFTALKGILSKYCTIETAT